MIRKAVWGFDVMMKGVGSLSTLKVKSKWMSYGVILKRRVMVADRQAYTITQH